MKRKEITGNRYGAWTVTDEADGAKCTARCDCGKSRHVYRNNLVNGRTKSCGCSRRINVAATRAKANHSAKKSFELPHRRAAALWGVDRRRAWRSAAFIKRTEEILRNGVCEATGIPFDLTMGEGKKWNGPSIDRKDNTKGYVDGNWQVVISAYNVAKNTWGDGPILAVADAIRRQQYEG